MAVRVSIVLLLLCACATYVPRPLDPPSPATWNARRLDDPGIAAALDSLGERGPPASWDDWMLAQAAWIVRPERARLHAELAVAEAARVTAGARVTPGVTTETEYSFSGTSGESRWGVALASVFTVELGGRRGARLARADAGRLLVVARGEEEGWEVRWRVREAAWDYALAEQRLAATSLERRVLDSLVYYSQRRYAEGTLGRLEIARVEAEREALGADVAGRRRERAEAAAALAAAVGVPSSELARAGPTAGSVAVCREMETRDSLLELALQRRWSLRVALAAYQVAEADLRQEVAQSWPDLAIGPGLFFDHGVKKWTILLGLPALPFGRNRGPIAEAEARRSLAARRVAEVQERVLAEVELGLAGCAAAAREQEVYRLTPGRVRLAIADSAWARGEIGRLELLLVELEVARVERRMTEAGSRLGTAALALERAVGIWTRGPAEPAEGNQ